MQVLSAGGNYSVQFLFETSRYGVLDPYFDVDTPDAIQYISTHPAEFVTKYLRVFSRTKVVLEGLAGPAVGAAFFPLFLLSAFSSGYAFMGMTGRWLARFRKTDSRPDPVGPVPADDERQPVFLMLVLVVALCCVLWAILFRVRYVAHVYPLMLIIICFEAQRFDGFRMTWSPSTKRVVVTFAVAYGLLYPAASALWTSYRSPGAFLGRGLPIHVLDYGDMARLVRERVPPDTVVVSELAHEIGWLTGQSTIHFPRTESQLRLLVNKFDVTALYERKDHSRDWPWIRDAFIPVDSDGGVLWLRRDIEERPR